MLFGRGYFQTSQLIKWNPDEYSSKNPHALITGSSGSGKTTLLREVIKYLANRNKYVFVIDLHGDLHVPGIPENYIEITARNSKYGISPFEFEKCSKNGGVYVQADTIIHLFRKTFMPNLGSLQEKVLKKLIIDTYRKVGITDEDESTWGLALPTMEDMKGLTDAIIERVNTGLHHDFVEKFQKCSQKINKLEQRQKSLDRLSENVDSLQVETIIEELQNDIGKQIKNLDEMWIEFRQAKLYGNALTDKFGTDLNVDIDFYSRRDTAKVLESLSVYITLLYESKVFHSRVPNLTNKGHLHRFDISGLDHNIQVFFTDILLQKVFRSKKLRGDYSKNSNKRRGKLTDTYIIIDESKLILPQGKDKENPHQAINRIASESRKYGLGMVLAAQKPKHFPEELLTNIDLKILLTTASNDAAQAEKLLGIKDKNLVNSAGRFGVAIISMGARDFVPVCLPWADLSSGK